MNTNLQAASDGQKKDDDDDDDADDGFESVWLCVKAEPKAPEWPAN